MAPSLPDPRLPIWYSPWTTEAPYARVADGYEWESVVTFTLALPDVVEAFRALRPAIDGSKPSRGAAAVLVPIEDQVDRAIESTHVLMARVGAFKVEDLARELSPAPNEPRLLQRAFAGTPLPDRLSERVVSDDHVRKLLLRHGRELGRLAERLDGLYVGAHESAGARFVSDQEKAAALVWNAHRPAPRLEPARLGWITRRLAGERWALACDGLLDRLSLEAFQLATLRPQVKPCSACGRLFVPFGREARCHGHLWSRGFRQPRAFCVRSTPFSIHPTPGPRRTEHERERDRTYHQIRTLRRQREQATTDAQRAIFDDQIRRAEERRAETLKPRGPRQRALPDNQEEN